MKKQPFSSPFSRFFPKKISRYFLTEVQTILTLHQTQSCLSPTEFALLLQYEQALICAKGYYSKANLTLLSNLYPLIKINKLSPLTEKLYAEILRIDPILITAGAPCEQSLTTVDLNKKPD